MKNDYLYFDLYNEIIKLKIKTLLVCCHFLTHVLSICLLTNTADANMILSGDNIVCLFCKGFKWVELQGMSVVSLKQLRNSKRLARAKC